ncbi:glutamate racemase [Chitinophaga terrae (ex Kim and Jung 2007)]|uniref:Glutamate racemase n=1 Tax=Chitinophaga terrae (ex Kim and Jung 2007) TaxID=408074 RepID=A0A1H4C219_9BACT|nr:glutamate racemase [Chitinophaga terrae (ex Kim and Jung 2007)]MDQ0108544.1 glutamate racemase [Chitinophaga terrae (ex Kim and Jung 2007)]GEP92166.1 glutamate racemase [Chitinophaga terrae (ex Kim and Jung 2007)]SEA54384.1 glutamate racemase [Chitinophaga terrae (ex Kim and Jung 2007)]
MGPIGVFDSGYGGLTVLKEIVAELPQYDYIYLGDNARAPYGNRGFDTIHAYTLECVEKLFGMGCPLVILACNTASAKALRTIQQKDLPNIAPDNRVLGVIRPTSEMVGTITETGEIGILATNGTVSSESYPLEIHKFFPQVNVHQLACPMWVPLIENNEHESEGADYFVKEYIDKILSKAENIDTLVLGCTHYPLLMKKIKQYLPGGITVLSQGKIVAHSLKDYLRRHPEMETRLSKHKQQQFFTTDDPAIFDKMAEIFYGKSVQSRKMQTR